MIDGRNLFDQTIKNNIGTYANIKQEMIKQLVV